MSTQTESNRKFALYGSLVGLIVVLDIVTKYVVERTLTLYHPVPVIGDYFRLTYIYNRGAAFGLSLGDYSRYFFLVLTVVALVVLFLWFRSTPASDRLRLFSIAAVTGGAIGNLIDRVRHEHGVVDFLDFGIGNLRWPVFNVADIAVTVGALLLAVSLWKEEAHTGEEPAGPVRSPDRGRV
jgi:signal peptidase II